MTEALLVIAGFAAGAGVAAAWFLLRRGADSRAAAEHASRARLLDEQIARHLAEVESLRQRLDAAGRERAEVERRASVIEEKLRARDVQFEEQRRLMEDAEKKLAVSFEAAGAKALRQNNEQFLALARQTFEKILGEAKGDVEKKQQAIDQLVKPIRELLEKQNVAVGDIEKKRETAYARLDEQIKVIAQSHEKLNAETNRLVSALRRPEQRGRWGEVQLRNVVELAGMTERCDFNEQVHVAGSEGAVRPDMIVKLPGGGEIPVDSKVALDAYLNAINDPQCDRAVEIKRHARQVQDHVARLAEKRYWDQFERTPGVVVLFMPLESALMAALEVNPNLHADAMQRHVLIATPTLLVALLRAVAYGWQQEAVATNAREIAEAGRELYERLSKFTEHFERVGAQLGRANESYNAAVGSMERSLLPAARKLKDLRATDRPDIELPPVIDVEPRQITSAELKPVSLPVDGHAPRDAV